MPTKHKPVIVFPNGEAYLYSPELWTAPHGGTILKGQAATDTLRAYRRRKMLAIVQPRATLHAVCTHRAASGMSARYRLLAPVVTDCGAVIKDITRQTAELCGFRLSRSGEIVMNGCGYNRVFAIGYELGRALWPNGTSEPHGTRNGMPDSDGGYALQVNDF